MYPLVSFISHVQLQESTTNVLEAFSVDEHADVVCVYIPPNVLDDFSVDEHC